MSDVEIEEYFHQRDGRWSGLTKLLLAKHGVTRLDLNRNWAAIRTWGWQCPVCGRDKSQIVRVANGVLLARLELHHDHIRDAIKSIFQAEFGQIWVEGAPRESLHVDDELDRMVTRFDDVLICMDCNAADGEAKRKLREEINPNFSFAPDEIAAFILARPNLSHRIDCGKALAAWQTAREDFERRLEFVGSVVDRVVRGEFRRRSYFISSEPVPRHQIQIYQDVLRAAESNLPAATWVRQGYEELEARSPFQMTVPGAPPSPRNGVAFELQPTLRSPVSRPKGSRHFGG